MKTSSVITAISEVVADNGRRGPNAPSGEVWAAAKKAVEALTAKTLSAAVNKTSSGELNLDSLISIKLVDVRKAEADSYSVDFIVKSAKGTGRVVGGRRGSRDLEFKDQDVNMTCYYEDGKLSDFDIQNFDDFIV